MSRGEKQKGGNGAMMNCWEFKKCGRDKTGDCPAYYKRAGKVCWIVAGTMCGGEVQGTFAKKVRTCIECDFYKYINKEARERLSVK